MRSVLLILLFLSSFCSLSQEPEELIYSIYFGGGSWYIDNEHALELKNFVQSIKNLSYYDISISSHTDNIGGKEFNAYLSRMRSESTIRLLQKIGVNPEAIKYIDYGEEAPVFDNDTWEGKLRNRRVDIKFTPIQF
jgi:outer membrane protein OmpA-like peptidoglycan-associated protein